MVRKHIPALTVRWSWQNVRLDSRLGPAVGRRGARRRTAIVKHAVVCIAAGLLLSVAAPSNVLAQLSPTAEWATHASNEYQVQANITYLTASGYESKLDVYRRRDVTTPQPTLIFYHGGGWVTGTKEAATMSILPWLEMGWNVINVEYRMARVALAPAAVEDAQCALRYVVTRAKDFNVDTS